MTTKSNIVFAVVLGAALVCGSMAMAHVAATPAPAQSAASLAAAQTPPEAKARKRSRCTNCGVIQTVRRIDAVKGQAATYEMTIRLRDGSTHIQSNGTPGFWKAGDRIMLIQGNRSATAPKT